MALYREIEKGGGVRGPRTIAVELLQFLSPHLTEKARGSRVESTGALFVGPKGLLVDPFTSRVAASTIYFLQPGNLCMLTCQYPHFGKEVHKHGVRNMKRCFFVTCVLFTNFASLAIQKRFALYVRVGPPPPPTGKNQHKESQKHVGGTSEADFHFTSGLSCAISRSGRGQKDKETLTKHYSEVQR